MASSSSSEPQPGPWFILGRVSQERARARGAPWLAVAEALPLELPLHEPPRVSRLTYCGKDNHLYIVANDKENLLLHAWGKPFPSPRDNFLVTLAREDDFWIAPAVDAASRGAFQVFAACQPNRDPDLPPFSGLTNAGLLCLRDGGFVIAELQANELQKVGSSRSVPLITFRSGEEDDPDKNKWEQTDLNWDILDDEDCPHWITHGVIAHDNKLWWVNLSRGLAVCDPAPANDLKPRLGFVKFKVLPGLLDNKRDHRPETIHRYRIVKPSAGKIRFVDVARKGGDGEPQDQEDEQTRVVVWTLADYQESTEQGEWENPPCQTTLAKIWNDASYVQRQMPREVPVLALVHPNKPAVVYFFLNEFVFSVDVKKSAVEDFALMPGQGAIPRPITQRDVLAWVRPMGTFKTVRY